MDFNFKELFGLILLILGMFIAVGTGLAFCLWLLKTVA